MLDTRLRPLSFPAEGIRATGLLYRLPTEDDIETVAPAFIDEDVGGAGEHAAVQRRRAPRAASSASRDARAQGLFIPLVIVDGEIQGGCTHAPLRLGARPGPDRLLALPARAGRGTATKTARFLAEHGFSLGLERIEARVFVGNTRRSGCSSAPASRAKASSPRCRAPVGRRADMTVYSLLPGE